MTQSYLGANIPQEWLQQYEDLARKNGKSLEELVQEALGQYLLSQSSPDPINHQLTQEIAHLKQRVIALEMSQGQINHLRVSLQVLEHKMAQLSSDSGKVSPQLSTNIENLATERDETDEYDEPDEVLWDFLPE